MLIPSMSQDIRAQIGDRSADEYDSDLSENEIEYEETGDEEISPNIYYSTTLQIMTKSPLASRKIVSIEELNDESFTSMIDIEPLSLEVETTGDKIEIEQIFVKTSPPDTVSVDNVEDEELFDSIVEISSINEHKKSIDEAFESILKAEDTITKDNLDTLEKLQKEEEIAQKVHETLENLLKEEEEVTKKIHDAVNAAPLKDDRFLPVEKVHEAINGTNENLTYKRIEVDVDNRTRYSSPLFKDYKLAPMKSIKITENNAQCPKSAPITSSNVFDPFPCHKYNSNMQSQIKRIPPIPHDDSISNLLHTTSLISRSHTDLTNGTNKLFNQVLNQLIESFLENLILNRDPDTNLMENLLPGENKVPF